MKSVVLEQMYSPEEVKAFNEKQKDWTAVCRICRKLISGSLDDLRNHSVNCHGE